MKTLFKQALDFFLYSNIFISLCAAAITAETYLLVHSEINRLYISFVFFSTLVFYDFPSLFFAEEAFSVNQSERHRWIIENRKVLMAFTVVAFIAVVITVFFFPFKFILWMMPNAVLAFAYFFPETRLRSITGLKATIVAFVWMMTTAFYPLVLASYSNSQQKILSQENILLITERFLFMLPLCVIFNVRDVEADRKAGVKTLPVIYGVKTTIVICSISLLLFSTLVISSRSLSDGGAILLFSGITTIAFVVFASERSADYYYSFWIDGMIILQAGLILFL